MIVAPTLKAARRMQYCGTTMKQAEAFRISGRTSAAIAHSIEAAVRSGGALPGAVLPTVRALASDLGVSTSTVADAYRTLRERGLVRTDGRRGTTVSPRPSITKVWSPSPPRPGLRNLADGNPDPVLLPSVPKAMRSSAADPALYGSPRKLPELVDAAIRDVAGDGLSVGDVAIVSGAIDGIGRILQTHLSVGDAVAVEDPSFPPLFDVLDALGLEARPIVLDDSGPIPSALERALHQGAQALVVTPRAQNPTGALITGERSKELRRVLRRYPDVLVVEDDTGGLATADPLAPVTDGSRARWAFVRSFSMVYGPDVRTGLVAADDVTLSRLEGRQWVTGGWVSHILQRLVAQLLSDPDATTLLQQARRTYGERRANLVDALQREGIETPSRSGFNVWVPVTTESVTVSALEAAGWAVAHGEPFRIASGPGIRVTASSISAEEAARLSSDIARSERLGSATYAG
jgi:DNA-binding transcriptional MocR family regulator